MRYVICDPTGNVTALVTDAVPVGDQPDVAQRIMAAHPEVEQVGFVDFDGAPALRMAGGEFCGNASLCAAALYANMRDAGAEVVRLGVSGATDPVEVRLGQMRGTRREAAVRMPPALGVKNHVLSFAGLSDSVPVVHMEGISHVVIDCASELHALAGRRGDAERAVRAWCEELAVAGLGVMFLEGEGQRLRCTPLVYVPASNTVYWEHSCASGTAAVGVCLGQSLTLSEPGGTLRVEQASDGTWLHGSVRILQWCA